jgi:uncharacterized protein (TIGR04255 family)
MTILQNAPLIYTICLARFSTVINMDEFELEFYSKVKGDYPNRKAVSLQEVQLNFAPEGIHHQQNNVNIWQFASSDKKTAIILTPNSIALHTIDYQGHIKFISEFEKTLTHIMNIDKIGINCISGIAIRYVDLIPETNKAKLNELLKPSVLPAAFSDVQGLEIIQGLYVGQYRSNDNNIRFQILRNPALILPVDLITPFIELNEWKFDRPENNFAIVDTDCSKEFNNNPSMDINTICDQIKELRFVAKSIFDEIGTPLALRIWAGEDQ